MAAINNVGDKESYMRLVLGIIFDLIAVFVPVAVGFKIFFVILAAFGISTGLFKFCPIYKILGISTCKKQ